MYIKCAQILLFDKYRFVRFKMMSGAIGGLNAENCEILKGTGIKGICVVSAIMKQENSYDAAKALKAKIMTICKQHCG